MIKIESEDSSMEMEDLVFSVLNRALGELFEVHAYEEITLKKSGKTTVYTRVRDI